MAGADSGAGVHVVAASTRRTLPLEVRADLLQLAHGKRGCDGLCRGLGGAASFEQHPRVYWFKYTSDGNTRVKFDVKALNDFVPQTAEAQIFRATIRVLASGCTPLDQREVLILVPPTPVTIQ